METIGQRLKKLRKEVGLSQWKLGIELDHEQASIYQWENDKIMIPTKAVLHYSEYFGVSTDWILKGEEHA